MSPPPAHVLFFFIKPQSPSSSWPELGDFLFLLLRVSDEQDEDKDTGGAKESSPEPLCHWASDHDGSQNAEVA